MSHFKGQPNYLANFLANQSCFLFVQISQNEVISFEICLFSQGSTLCVFNHLWFVKLKSLLIQNTNIFKICSSTRLLHYGFRSERKRECSLLTIRLGHTNINLYFLSRPNTQAIFDFKIKFEIGNFKFENRTEFCELKSSWNKRIHLGLIILIKKIIFRIFLF